MLNEETDYEASCHGCGIVLMNADVAYENTARDTYCAECYEAIKGDPESLAGLVDDNPRQAQASKMIITTAQLTLLASDHAKTVLGVEFKKNRIAAKSISEDFKAGFNAAVNALK